MSIQRSSSNIPNSFSHWSYDVFLSFRGEDTCKGFLGHLYHALKHRGINVFMDDKELQMGKSTSPELSKAIEESRISIIIFSRNYASSTWCLDKLVKSIECMKILKQIVVPIFYDVDPSMVRKQVGKFHEAFLKHEDTFRENIEKVQNWRTALTEVANLRGWDLRDGNESEFIQEIVKEISNKLTPTTSKISEDLLGIQSRVMKLRRLMCTKSDDDVCIVGIYGMGGIGKTTIARAVYDLISYEFDGSSFLANVRESSEKNGMVSLKRQLISQIVRGTDINVWDVHKGVQIIRSKLWHKKVLIVIDDVNDIKQLKELIGKHVWLGSGSRIIITTRDKHLLTTYGVDEMYKAEELDDNEALHLFSLKAFKNYQPLSEYMELSKCVVKYTSGLPLALEVLGSLLFDRTIEEWESAIQSLGRDFEKGIFNSLRVSFEGLTETEKEIFLDVACFFKGSNKEFVTRIMDACGFNPTIGIGVLVDKSLLTIIHGNILWMHDLLQELGQQIVKRDFPKEPGKCSRLWKEEDVHHVLTKNTGTEAVEGIILEKELPITIKAKVFEKMTNLRLLRIYNVRLSEGLEYLSNELRFLEWHGYPLKSLPSSLQLDKTVELKMHKSCIEQLWKETKLLDKLKVINLSHSKNLSKTPDFTNIPNLEELILEGCTRLREIHSSLLLHNKLILLNLKDCISLTTLPSKVDMKSLQKFVLSGCLKLKKFPKMVGGMECLLELFLDETSIKELSFPIELPKGLVLLSLKDCKNLVSLPSNINCLKSLKILNISGCSKLQNVPENLGEVECLEKLDLSGTAIMQPTSSIFMMKNLKELSFSGCKAAASNSWNSIFPFNFMSKSSDPIPLMLPSLSGLHSLRALNLSYCNLREGSFPSDVGSLVSLKELDLRGNNFVSLPRSINHLYNLNLLYLDDCKRLQSLHELPPNVNFVYLSDCESLETLSNALQSYRQGNVNCMNCFKLLDYNCALPILEAGPGSIANCCRIVIPGSEIPKWFNHQSEGSSIRIKRHQNLILKGFAMCFVFCCKKVPPNLLRQGPLHDIQFSSNLMPVNPFVNPFIGIGHRCNEDVPDHLYLECQSIGPFHNPHHDSFEFKFESLSPQFVKLKRCAVHLIYEQVDELNHVMSDGISSVSGNLIEFHQDFVAQNIDVATTKRSLADCDNSDDDKPQLKRQKKLQFS